MKRLFPLKPDKTLICHLFSPRTTEEAIQEAKAAAKDGAEGIAVELFQFAEEERSLDAFRKIIRSVPLPFMFLDYRNDRLGWNDEQRAEMLLDAARAGAGMIDIPGDLFAPAPDERTRNPLAIRKQKKLIEALHALGSQALISSHPQRPMTTRQVTAQLQDFARRGADVVKLVARVDTAEELQESLTTTLHLTHTMQLPFVYLCAGKFSRLQRMLSLPLGGAITFGIHARHDFAPYDQPTIKEFLQVRDGIGTHVIQDKQLIP